MKGRRAGAGFLEDVSEGPIRHRVGGVPDVADFVQDEGGAVVTVVDRIEWCVGTAPLGVMKF